MRMNGLEWMLLSPLVLGSGVSCFGQSVGFKSCLLAWHVWGLGWAQQVLAAGAGTWADLVLLVGVFCYMFGPGWWRLGQSFSVPTGLGWHAAPRSDLDLTTATDGEDLLAALADVVGFVLQDLYTSLEVVGLGLGLGWVGWHGVASFWVWLARWGRG
jgi:hypothetical protein